MLAKREESIYSHWQSSNFELTHRQLAAILRHCMVTAINQKAASERLCLAQKVEMLFAFFDRNLRHSSSQSYLKLQPNPSRFQTNGHRAAVIHQKPPRAVSRPAQAFHIRL